MSFSEEELRLIEEKEQRAAELEALVPISFAEYEAQMRKWMLVADVAILKLLPALYIANALPGRDAVWVMVIGPSGGGKTELLGSLLDMPLMYPISLLTPNTFLSGFPGKGDTSLLPKLTGKIMIFKDWTSILSMNKDARNEIMGQLREIYDGHMKKPFGNGRVAEWSGKVGLIAGVTGAIDIAQQMHTTLGERFIHYRIDMPDRLDAARRCLQNGKDVVQMRKEMKDAMYAFMKGMDTATVVPELPAEAQEALVRVANLATMARSGVIRDFGMKKEVLYVPSSEMPTRIVQQLSTIATALMIVGGGKFDPVIDGNILTKIALDSIPQTNRMVMEVMAQRSMLPTSKIATRLGYPTGPIKMYLENLALLGVCTRHKADEVEGEGNADKWEMKEEFKEIICAALGYVRDDQLVDVEDEFSPP